MPGEYADLASLLGAWAQHESAYADYLHGLTQEDLKRPHRADGHTYHLGDIILSNIRAVDGVTQTMTCLVLSPLSAPG